MYNADFLWNAGNGHRYIWAKNTEINDISYIADTEATYLCFNINKL